MPSTTLNYSATLANRFAAAVGEDWNLRDSKGERRNATGAECKQWIADRVREVIERTERAPKEKAAIAAVTTDPVDIT